MLPHLCDRSLSLNDQQHAVLQIEGLAANVCSLCLQENRVTEAVQKLQFGRGLLLRYMFDKRDNVSALQEDYPDLASEHKKILSEVNRTENPSLNLSDRQNLARQRIKSEKRIKALIHQIRQREGYESFLLEPTIHEVTGCVADGLIIVVNATDIRISSDRVSSLELPEMKGNLDEWLSDQQYRHYRSASANSATQSRDVGSGTRNGDNKIFLEWLWSTCVKLVIRKISESTSQPRRDVLRLWWLGTGLASTFPFHAAGCYQGDPTDNCLQQTISSYTPSIRALSCSHSLGRTQGLGGEELKSVLVLTMPTTPGQSPLDGVRDEWFAIRNACQGVFQSELLEYPTAEEALRRLPVMTLFISLAMVYQIHATHHRAISCSRRKVNVTPWLTT